MKSNVNGTRGKLELDPVKVSFIRKVTFQQYPLKSDEREKKAWSDCVTSIDEANKTTEPEQEITTSYCAIISVIDVAVLCLLN